MLVRFLLCTHLRCLYDPILCEFQVLVVGHKYIAVILLLSIHRRTSATSTPLALA